jgi:hypothetical protein
MKRAVVPPAFQPEFRGEFRTLARVNPIVMLAFWPLPRARSSDPMLSPPKTHAASTQKTKVPLSSYVRRLMSSSKLESQR